MEEPVLHYDVHGMLRKSIITPSTLGGTRGHNYVVKLIFAVAVSLQLVFVFKRIKILYRRILQLLVKVWKSLFRRFKFLFRCSVLPRQETRDDIIRAIPLMCQTVLLELKDEVILCQKGREPVICLLQYTLTTQRRENLPAALYLKSAVSWLLCDLLWLLARCNKHKLALPWTKRPALTYRTIDSISHLMEGLAYDVITCPLQLPVLLEFDESLTHLRRNTRIALIILDLHDVYIRLQRYIPLLLMPRFAAIKSRYDVNLERYGHLTSLKMSAKSAAFRVQHCADAPLRDQPRRLGAHHMDFRSGEILPDVEAVHDAKVEERSWENWMLSVTELNSLLQDKSLDERQKAFIIRRQMALRNIHSPKVV